MTWLEGLMMWFGSLALVIAGGLAFGVLVEALDINENILWIGVMFIGAVFFIGASVRD